MKLFLSQRLHVGGHQLCCLILLFFSFFYFYLVVIGDSDRNYHNNQILYLNSVNLR